MSIMKNQKINFKTPNGLKIRLNHRYFFYQITKEEKYCTDDEIVNSDVMYKATANIETVYLMPTMLIQFFAIFAAVFRISTPVFCAVSAALYIFGCIWRCSKQDLILSTILMFFATLYKMLWWLCYIALIVLVFALGCTYLIVPYIVARVGFCIFSLLQNHLILSVTKKRYGVPFNDTEICAFRVFHLFSESDERISDYINSYVSVIYGEEEKETSNEPTDNIYGEQLSLFDTLSEPENGQLTLDDVPSMEETVILNLLSPRKGHVQKTIEITDKNREQIQKWLNRETNSVYCFEVFRDGEPQYYYVKKEMFDMLKNQFDEI